jgi:hypothetical protein
MKLISFTAVAMFAASLLLAAPANLGSGIAQAQEMQAAQTPAYKRFDGVKTRQVGRRDRWRRGGRHFRRHRSFRRHRRFRRHRGFRRSRHFGRYRYHRRYKRHRRFRRHRRFAYYGYPYRYYGYRRHRCYYGRYRYGRRYRRCYRYGYPYYRYPYFAFGYGHRGYYGYRPGLSVYLRF